MRSMWLILASAVLLASAPSKAEDAYPSRQVSVIVPFAAGGTADIFARMVANYLQAKLGKPFVVENVGGAGSIVGVTRLARSAPDGLTLGLASTSALAINPSLYGQKLSYQPDKDLQPVVQISVVPNVLVVNPDKIQARTMPDLIAYLKANPDKVSFGSAGVGTSQHRVVPADDRHQDGACALQGLEHDADGPDQRPDRPCLRQRATAVAASQGRQACADRRRNAQACVVRS